MNGRGRIKRVRNHRATWDLKQTEQISGNYYPINSAIMIKDNKSELTIVPDRAQGNTMSHSL